jgi:hypothetical protein
MQAIGQKAVDRIHLHISMFQTEHFYCMIIFNRKLLVLSIWHSNHLYFIIYILRTKIGQPAGHVPWWMLSTMDSQKCLAKVGQLVQLGLHTGCGVNAQDMWPKCTAKLLTM